MASANGPQLLDHRILFFYPFHPGKPSVSPPPGFVPCTRGADEALRLYLDPQVHRRLHDQRWCLPEPLDCPQPGVICEQVEVAQVDAELGLLAAVFKGKGTPEASVDLTALMEFVDVGRLRGPLYPGQKRPAWTLPDGRHFGALEDLLATWLPDSTPIFDDLRLFTFSYAAIDEVPQPGLRYALAAADPPGMPAPSAAFVERFFATNGYRRWEADLSWYAFTHYSGALVRTANPPAGWLARVVTHQYIDVLGWAVCVAARRHMLAQIAAVDPSAMRASGELAAHFRDFEWPRISEQDQGRQLARLWLDVIEKDYGDLARLERFDR